MLRSNSYAINFLGIWTKALFYFFINGNKFVCFFYKRSNFFKSYLYMSIHHWKVPDQYKFEFECEFLIHLDKLQYMRKILSIGYIRHLIFKIKVLGSLYIQKKRNILRKFRYLLLEARHLDKIQIQFRRYHRHGSNTIHCQQEVDYYIV